MDRNQAKEFFERDLLNRSSWYRLTRPNPPLWIGRMCTQLAVLLGDDPVEFLASHIDYKPDATRATINLFTRARLIRAEASTAHPVGGVAPNPPAPADTLRVWSVARSSLIRLEADGGRDLFTGPWPGDWPGSIDVRATYADATITLPGDDATEEHMEAFFAFLPSLSADLEPRI